MRQVGWLVGSAAADSLGELVPPWPAQKRPNPSKVGLQEDECFCSDPKLEPVLTETPCRLARPVNQVLSLVSPLVMLLLTAPAAAQKAPAVGYAFPASVRAGEATEVVLGGYDWTPDMQWFTSNPRIKLEVLGPPSEVLISEPPYWFGPKSFGSAYLLPREVPVRITVPADVSPGLVRWQVANANGASAHATLYVSAGPDVVEDERAGDPQPLASLPVAVSGRLIKIEDVDRYTFRAPHSGPITCTLVARQLGADINGVIEIHEANGRLVADAVDTQGRDLSLTFAARAGEQYVISVRDFDFRGDWSHVYRLQIAPGPSVVAALPAAGRRGETREVEFVGWGVATGEARLETLRRQVAFPADPSASSMDYCLETPFGAAQPYTLGVSDLAELVESDEPVHSTRRLVGPCAVTGLLDERYANDHFLLETKQGEVWEISLAARAIGSLLDVSLRILDPQGAELAALDDLPGTTDTALEFTAAADGVYQLVVVDLSGASGSAGAAYRLEVKKRSEGFSLRTPELAGVPIGGTAELLVTAARQGGFAGPIKLAVAGLPEGISAPDELVLAPGQGELKIALAAAADAPAWASPATVTGTAVVGETTVTHVALAPASGNRASRDLNDELVETVLVCATMKPRVRVTPVDNDGGRTVHRGTTFPAPVIVERLEGFEGEVLLKMASVQARHRQGIRGPELVVPPGVGLIEYPVFMPEWLETSRTSRMILIGVTQVADPRGTVRHLVSPMEGRITMSIEGALLKLSYPGPETVAEPGQPFDLPVKIARSAKLPEPAVIELHVPDGLQDLVSAEPITAGPEQSDLVLRVATLADPRLSGEHTLTIRATALERGYLPVISEVQVPVEFTPLEPVAAAR